MTGNTKWFTKLYESVKKVIGFANGRHVTSTGRGNIVVIRKDGQRADINNVLYVPSMTNNLISIVKVRKTQKRGVASQNIRPREAHHTLTDGLTESPSFFIYS